MSVFEAATYMGCRVMGCKEISFKKDITELF